MGDKTKIAWTDATWNTVVGCTKVSPGCANCYAEKLLSTRMKHMPIYGDVTKDGKWTGQTGLLAHRLDQPLRWKRPRKIFVNDLGDTFHESVPFEFLARIWAVMILAHQHTFQVLTKRPERMLAAITDPAFYDAVLEAAKGIRRTFPSTHLIGISNPATFPAGNIWLGVTCEDQQRANERIPILLHCPAAVRFVSAEPLIWPIDFGQVPLEPGDMNLMRGLFNPLVGGRRKTDTPWRIDWVIIGGESGPRARPCDLAWIRSIRDQCREADVPVFVKQLGSSPAGLRMLSHVLFARRDWKLKDRAGADPAEWPEDLRVREYPTQVLSSGVAA